MKGNTKEIFLGMKENRNGGPSFQPSSFVVLSSTSLSLPKWVWSLLSVGFLFLSSFAFFIWPGCGFPGYKEEGKKSPMKCRITKQSFQRQPRNICLRLSVFFFFLLLSTDAHLLMGRTGLQPPYHYRCDWCLRSLSAARLWQSSASRSQTRTWWRLNPRRSAVVDRHTHTRPECWPSSIYLCEHQRRAFVDLSNKRESSPESPPGYKSGHCGTGGKYLFPNPPRFCTCDCVRVPVEQRVSGMNSAQ